MFGEHFANRFMADSVEIMCTSMTAVQTITKFTTTDATLFNDSVY